MRAALVYAEYKPIFPTTARDFLAVFVRPPHAMSQP